MQSEVKFAGFGGQGILLSGKILAHAAMEQGLEVAWVPSYGPEMRGGTAYCTVVISDRPIGSLASDCYEPSFAGKICTGRETSWHGIDQQFINSNSCRPGRY